MPKRADAVPYLRTRLRGAAPLYSWEPGPGLLTAGWPFVTLAKGFVGTERARRLQAETEARDWNAKVAAWRAGDPIDPTTGERTDAAAAARRPRRHRPPPPSGTLDWLAERYLASREFAALMPRTQRSYRQNLDQLRAWAGDKPAGGITAKAVKTLYWTLHDPRPATAKAPARPGRPALAAALVVMGRILWKWARSEDIRLPGDPFKEVVVSRPPTQEGRLWTREEEAHMVAAAERLGLFGVADAIVLNAWFGQRECDILVLRKDLLVDGVLAFRPSKTNRTTGKKAFLPVHVVPTIAARIEGIQARHKAMGLISPVWIVNDATRWPYVEDTFRHDFARVRAAAVAGTEADGDRPAMPAMASCKDLQFRTLRHTGFTRLLLAGVSIEDACTISAHSLKGGYAIVDRYNIRTAAGAERAFRTRAAAEGLLVDDGETD